MRTNARNTAAHRLCVLMWLIAIALPAHVGAETLRELRDRLLGPKRSQQAATQPTEASIPSTVEGRLYANMNAAGRQYPVNLSEVESVPTPIRGLFQVRERASKSLIAYTNERGTLQADSLGVQAIEQGVGLRQFTAQELEGLRREVVANLDPAWTIPITHGDGGGRKILLISAVDCSACRRFEQALAKHSNSVDTTFIVFPSSLSRIETSEGRQGWDVAVRLLCAVDSTAAWKAYWNAHQVPRSLACNQSADTLEDGSKSLWNILRGAGVQPTGYPSLVDEAGRKLPLVGPSWTAASIQEIFGPMPSGTNRVDTEKRWLPLSAPISN